MACVIKADSFNGLIPSYEATITKDQFLIGEEAEVVLKFNLNGDRKKVKKKKKKKKTNVSNKIYYVPTLSVSCNRHFFDNFVEASIMVDEETLTFSNAFVWRDFTKSVRSLVPQHMNLQISSRYRVDIRKNLALSNSIKLMLERERVQGSVELENYLKVKTMSLVVPMYRFPNILFTARHDMTRWECGMRMTRAFGISGLSLYAKMHQPTDSEPLRSWMLGSQYKASIGTLSFGISHDPNHPNENYLYGIRLNCPL